MGWTGIHTEESIGKLVKKLYNYTNDETGTTVTVVGYSLVNFSECYLALSVMDSTGRKKVVGEVVVFKYDRNNHFNLKYKQMGEFSEPYFYNCPKRILDMLSPLDECGYSVYGRECAERWRQKVTAKINRRKAVAHILKGSKFRITSNELEYTYRSDGNVTANWEGVDRCLGAFSKSNMRKLPGAQDALQVFLDNKWETV